MQVNLISEDQQHVQEDERASQSSYESENPEEDNKEFGIYQCLPVDDREPDWDTEEPLSVEEYLRRVRYEARHLPSVVTGDVDPKLRETPPSRSLERAIPTCPDEYKPSLRWLREFLDKFSSLRRQLYKEHLLLTGQVEGLPLRVTYSPALDAQSQQALQDLSINSPSSVMPELESIRGVDQLTIVRRLQSTVQHLTKSDAILLTSSSRNITKSDEPIENNVIDENVDSVNTQPLFSETSAEIYALSARIEKPLHGDTSAAYRKLLRWCATQRASSVKSLKDEALPHLNILIAISGAYFGQDEELATVWEEY